MSTLKYSTNVTHFMATQTSGGLMSVETTGLPRPLPLQVSATHRHVACDGYFTGIRQSEEDSCWQGLPIKK